MTVDRMFDGIESELIASAALRAEINAELGHEPADQPDDELGSGHGVGDVVEQGAVGVSEVVGGRHSSSPSSVGSTPTVGDEAGPEDELRAHTSGPGSATGDAL